LVKHWLPKGRRIEGDKKTGPAAKPKAKQNARLESKGDNEGKHVLSPGQERGKGDHLQDEEPGLTFLYKGGDTPSKSTDQGGKEARG